MCPTVWKPFNGPKAGEFARVDSGCMNNADDSWLPIQEAISLLSATQTSSNTQSRAAAYSNQPIYLEYPIQQTCPRPRPPSPSNPFARPASRTPPQKAQRRDLDSDGELMDHGTKPMGE